MNTTAKLSSFVIFILVGSTVFSLTFRAVNGDLWVEHLLTGLPGGQIGFLIVVNILVFLLAFFLDFFELAFIIVPLLAPVADKLGHRPHLVRRAAGREHADLVHAPAVRLRAVLPAQRRAGQGSIVDKITGKPTAPVTTGQIYWGAVPFVVIQVIMVGIVIVFPGLVTGNLDRHKSTPASRSRSRIRSTTTSSSKAARSRVAQRPRREPGVQPGRATAPISRKRSAAATTGPGQGCKEARRDGASDLEKEFLK